ncbi:hypothetical protein [Paratractidigestivibacter sp.]|uniref:GntT/GntP/DsdX family permease n=1 Tax=Paratractidigestivibacter sp. TaxID=2847316 RepID=UPI003A94B839
MAEPTFMADPTRLVVSAIIGIVLLLALIIKFKLHPVLSMMVSAIFIGIGAGMPLGLVASTVTKGVGMTLQNIALLIGLGSMFGQILEESGGAKKIAQTFIDKFGQGHSSWALGITGLVIRWMLQDCGLGQVIGPVLESSPLPLVVVGFLIAVLVRASVGSSIVAMTMASGIMAAMPAVAASSVLMRAAICIAICGGATALSHVNDAGFWMCSSFLEIDEKTTLSSWTVMETLIGIVGLVCALVISMFA